MKYLLDTHTLLWALAEPHRLSETARGLVEDSDQSILVSAANVWEISILRSLDRIDVPNDLVEQIRRANFDFVEITPEQAWSAGALPRLHRDPFDRMLIAQSVDMTAPLITKDPLIAAYKVDVVW